MLYDILMIASIVSMTTAALWASRKISQAVKDGKIRYIGKVKSDGRQ